MDKFLFTDKDDIFLSVKTTTGDQMSYMRDATINYELETLTGFGVKAMLRHRNDEPTGKLEYLRNDAAQTRVHDVTTSGSEPDAALCSGRIICQLQTTPRTCIAGCSYLYPDSCHGLSKEY